MLQIDQKLLRALLAVEFHPPVRVRDNQNDDQRVTAADCLLRVERAGYSFSSRKGKIRLMELITDPIQWIKSYRNSEAPVLQPGLDWIQNCETKKL